MVNILVPTDFSDLSKVAVQYAVKIANKLGGNVTMLHVVNIQQTVRATMKMKVRSLERDLITHAKEDLENLLNEVSQHVETRQPIKYKVVRGASFNESVRRAAKRLRTGLIVMGTRGASGLKKAIMGSNTASIIEISHVPVLAVPEKASFKSFRNVIYATDLKHLEKELNVLVPYVEPFGSTIHVLHILKNGKDMEEIEERIEKAVQKTGYKKFVTLVTVDPDIDGAIDQYSAVCKADLLAMFTHELSFYEKLFDKSITRKMAFHSKTPLLAFKQKK
jgi:nucleotide-binding universal stress UspA family protein